jgi:hypothetical protein
MYHSVCPLVRLGTPHPLSRKRVVPPPGTKGGGGTQGEDDTRLRVFVFVFVFVSVFEQLEKKLSTLSTLCRKLQEQQNRGVQ